MTLDPRLNAYRDDLADERLRGRVAAPRYVVGKERRVVVGRAAVHRSPDPVSETLTFYHYGEEALVFEEGRRFAWCQSRVDGYVGYVEARQLAPAAGDAAPPTHYVATPGSFAYRTPDLRLPVQDFLPRHSAVIVAETGLVTRGTEYARLDTGHCLPLACLSPEQPRSPEIVAAAELYLGCPYLWGGRSFFGIDCSGLVQSAFRDIGITVLRDTDMQRDTIGVAVPLATPAELRRGDLIYMPGHVMICAGEGNVIHADGATMTVRRDNLAALMNARNLRFADFTVRRCSKSQS